MRNIVVPTDKRFLATSDIEVAREWVAKADFFKTVFEVDEEEEGEIQMNAMSKLLEETQYGSNTEDYTTYSVTNRPPITVISPIFDNLLLRGSLVAVILLGIFGAIQYSRVKTKKEKLGTPETVEPLLQRQFCINCGNELRTGFELCDKCGTKQT